MLDVFIILALVGLGFVVIRADMRKVRANQDDLEANGVQTTGVVESRNLGSPKTLSFYIHYTFEDTTGASHKARKQMGLYAFQYKKGEQVVVYYDPADPSRSTIPIRRILLKKGGLPCCLIYC